MAEKTANRFSFTFGGLLLPETQIIAEEYLRTGDWDLIKKASVEENIIRKTRKNSRIRYFYEIRDRLKGAYNWELPYVAGKTGSRQETLLVILAVTTRYYRLLQNFFNEVVRNKVFRGDLRFMEYEYGAFWEKQMENYPEAGLLKDSTVKKLEQVSFRVLQEAGYLPMGRKGQLIKPTVPYDLQIRYGEEGDKDALRTFLLSDREISALMRGTL